MGRYFEEFQVGEKITTQARPVTDSDIMNFATLTGDNNRIHTDAEFSRSGPFGKRISHGLLGLSVASGLLWQTGILDGTVIAFREINEFERQLTEQDWTEVQSGVEVKQVASADGLEQFVLARSPDRRAKEQAMHERFLKRMEDGLARLQAAAAQGRLKDEGQAQRLGERMAPMELVRPEGHRDEQRFRSHVPDQERHGLAGCRVRHDRAVALERPDREALDEVEGHVAAIIPLDSPECPFRTSSSSCRAF